MKSFLHEITFTEKTKLLNLTKKMNNGFFVKLISRKKIAICSSYILALNGGNFACFSDFFYLRLVVRCLCLQREDCWTEKKRRYLFFVQCTLMLKYTVWF